MKRVPIRRPGIDPTGSQPGGTIKLDVKPDSSEEGWQWTVAAAGSERDALACGLTAISCGLKVYVILPDDPKSDVLDWIGLTDTPDPQPKRQ